MLHDAVEHLNITEPRDKSSKKGGHKVEIRRFILGNRSTHTHTDSVFCSKMALNLTYFNSTSFFDILCTKSASEWHLKRICMSQKPEVKILGYSFVTVKNSFH